MSLERAIKKVIKNVFKYTNTVSIGTVASVDRENMRCNVYTKTYGNNVGPFPLYLESVPIWFPGGGNSRILYPIAEGDTVLVVFSKNDTGLSLVDDEPKEEVYGDKYFPANNAIVLGGFTLDKDMGSVIYDDEVYEIPEEGIRILSDEAVRIHAPCVDVPSPILQGSEESEDSTTSGPFVQAWRFNFVTGPWKYIINFFFETTNSAGGQDSAVKVELDDSIVITQGRHSIASGNEFIGQCGFIFQDFTSEGVGPNSHYIDFDFRRPSGGTAKIRRKRIVIYKVIENTGCPIP